MDHDWAAPATYRVKRDLAGAFSSVVICAAVTAAVIVTALDVHAHGVGAAAALAGVLAAASFSALDSLLEALDDYRGFAYPTGDDEHAEEDW